MGAAQKPLDRTRLDALLVGLGIYDSRSRARDAIARGTVFVGGAVALKAGQPVLPSIDIRIDDPARRYVSRAALKLIAGLEYFGFDAEVRAALDIGASTGGFTQVLLERGARHVTAIDVGHDQMDARLRSDPRVACLEGLNARNLVAADLSGKVPEFVVSDVSFISLTLALPPALDLAAPGARAILLVKPQFEAGRAAIGRGGVLRNPEEGERTAHRLLAWLDEVPGWRAVGHCPSPVEGGDGNREFLLAGVKDR